MNASKINPGAAEILALRAVEYLASTDDLLDIFLGASGLARDELASSLQTAEFQGAVLDFILMDDQWVIGLAQFSQSAPEEIAAARAALPGGEVPHWT